ncbi:MAG: hypothetical protein JO316_24685 [Abitibacteriaceae bacterium]|nr:hypothetical protein [Abditibacteriaceae bacterium]
MDALLERFTRINQEVIPSDAAFEVVHRGNYIFFQTAIKVGPVPTSILNRRLPVERIFIIYYAVMLSFAIYTLPLCNCPPWLPRPLAWLLMAGIGWGAYKLIQSVERQREGYNRVPRQLFAVDVERQKLVLNMPATEAKSPHRKAELNEIQGFYTVHEVTNDTFCDYLYATGTASGDLEVYSGLGSTRDLEEMAIILATICNKPVWRRLQSGATVPLGMDLLVDQHERIETPREEAP